MRNPFLTKENGNETSQLDQTVLRQFIGSEQYFRHGLIRNIVFTEGAKYVVDAAGAYWLLDEIALAQRGQPDFYLPSEH